VSDQNIKLPTLDCDSASFQWGSNLVQVGSYASVDSTTEQTLPLWLVWGGACGVASASDRWWESIEEGPVGIFGRSHADLRIDMYSRESNPPIHKSRASNVGPGDCSHVRWPSVERWPAAREPPVFQAVDAASNR